MDRTKFYNETTINGIEELDFLRNTLSSFELVHEPAYYRTDIQDVGRPDLISYENYGTEYYWWIICLVNGIENPLEDIAVGTILQIPHIADINVFYRKFKIR